MIESAKMLLNILKRAGYETYYIGGKCRTELNNMYHDDNKLVIKDIDIVTNATVDQLKKLFPHSDDVGKSFQVLIVSFGNFKFEIATYRKDVYENENGEKLEKPCTEVVSSLEEDRKRRDFTCNAIAQDIEGNYIDFVFESKNKKISAMSDIQKGIIRAIGDPKQRFIEDPLRILRAFRFMSQLNYVIETNTLKQIKSNIKLLNSVPSDRIGPEMNKLIVGTNANNTLRLMKEIGVFKTKCSNEGKQSTILPCFNEFDDEKFDILKKFKSSTSFELEMWAALFLENEEDVKQNLDSIKAYGKYNTEKIKWIIKNINIVNCDSDLEYRKSIYESINIYIISQGIHYMKDLIMKVGHINKMLHHGEDEYKVKAKKLFFNFCARPYFYIQLNTDGDKMMAIAQKKAGPWIKDAKEVLINSLIESENFPSTEEEYEKYVVKAVNISINK